MAVPRVCVRLSDLCLDLPHNAPPAVQPLILFSLSPFSFQPCLRAFDFDHLTRYNTISMDYPEDFREFLKLLEKTKAINDPLKKRLFVLAVITKALEKYKVRPVLIGGGAVEYYTYGGYATQDTDLAVENHQKLDEVLKKLKFKSEGRYWIREDIGALIESPTGNLKVHGETAPLTEVKIDNLKCYIIGIEDLIIDRLNGYVHWKWQDDLRWAKEIAKNHADQLDWKYLRQRAKEENISSALKELQ